MAYCEDLNLNQGENKKLFHDLSIARNQIEKFEIETQSLRTQLKHVKEDTERRVGALERRNLELETDNNQLNAQYKLLNEKSGKIQKQDEELRKLQHEVTDDKSRKKELELQVSKLQESKHEV